jgi:hypothetical protein
MGAPDGGGHVVPTLSGNKSINPISRLIRVYRTQAVAADQNHDYTAEQLRKAALRLFC